MLSKFKTQKSMKTHFRGLIDEIGVCSSIKTNYPKYYPHFTELVYRHPHHEFKCLGMIDIAIKRNLQYNNLELYIMSSTGGYEVISYNLCITQKLTPKYQLKASMRTAIDNQITEYRQSAILECVFCGSTDNPHIDHIILFKQLYTEFLLEYIGDIPTKFNKNAGHLCIFTENDAKFMNAWNEYHKINASLRVLCCKCNTSRSKIR
jgi:hypothetical protein